MMAHKVPPMHPLLLPLHARVEDDKRARSLYMAKKHVGRPIQWEKAPVTQTTPLHTAPPTTPTTPTLVGCPPPRQSHQ